MTRSSILEQRSTAKNFVSTETKLISGFFGYRGHSQACSRGRLRVELVRIQPRPWRSQWAGRFAEGVRWQVENRLYQADRRIRSCYLQHVISSSETYEISRQYEALTLREDPGELE